MRFGACVLVRGYGGLAHEVALSHLGCVSTVRPLAMARISMVDSTSTPRDFDPVSTEMDLSALITTHKGTRSYERLSRDCGGGVSAVRLNQLVRLPIKNFPDPATMTHLARGLTVPVREVLLATARSVGMNLPTGYDTDSLTLAGVADLPTTAREAIANVAREMVRLYEGSATREDVTGNAEHPAPIDAARVDAGRTAVPAELSREQVVWDQRAAELQARQARPLSDAEVISTLGPRPGEVEHGRSSDVAGHTSGAGRRRSAV